MLARDLVELAREGSPDKRRALLRHMTGSFFEGVAERSNAEADLFVDIVIRIAQDVDPVGRLELAERVAGEDLAPHRLVLFLVLDEITVARPVIERSEALNDQDLLFVAKTMGEEHLLAVARRRAVSSEVSDALVRFGTPMVLIAASRNPGVRFSGEGFAALTERAAGDEPLQFALARRDDLPNAVILELARLLTDRLGGALATSGETTDVDAPAASPVQAAIIDRDRDTYDLSQIIRDLRSGKTTLDVEIPRLARHDKAFDIATIMAELTGVDHATTMKSLTGTSDDSLIVLFRSFDLSWGVFEVVLQLRAKRQRRIYVRSAQIQRAYRDMDVGMAKRIVRSLQVRRNPDGGKAA